MRAGPKDDPIFHGAVLDGRVRDDSFPSILRSIDPLAHVKELTEIARLVGEGKKIEAVKLYRETFDKSLMDPGMLSKHLTAVSRSSSLKKIIRPLNPAMQLNPPMWPKTIQRLLCPRRQRKSREVPGSFSWSRVFLLHLGIGVLIYIAWDSPSRAPAGGSNGQSNRVGVLTEVANLKAEANELLKPTLSYGDATLLLSFGAKGINPGQFDDARPIAVVFEGAIYNCEYQGGRVEVYDPEGKFVTQWNTGNRKSALLGLAVSNDGTVREAQPFCMACTRFCRSGHSGGR